VTTQTFLLIFDEVIRAFGSLWPRKTAQKPWATPDRDCHGKSSTKVYSYARVAFKPGEFTTAFYWTLAAQDYMLAIPHRLHNIPRMLVALRCRVWRPLGGKLKTRLIDGE